MQMITKMSEEERMNALKASRKMCVCGRCPSYNDCAMESKELLYCVLGKSSECITEEGGCLCPSVRLLSRRDLHMTFLY